ncbi:Uncharacterised protein [Mycobacterium tuberculosis]|nr:Uncharacterised protein [Mycobacterium tuberculosis]
MVCHSDVYQGLVFAGLAASPPGGAAVAAPGGSWTWNGMSPGFTKPRR